MSKFADLKADPKPTYRGRFAPSPTGDLHFGSLVAALVSYLQAKANDGFWLLRIEDVDQTRTLPGADRLIINTLARFGLHSDEEVIYQSSSSRQAAYAQAHQQLSDLNLTYRCTCTRKQLVAENIYPGTCRKRQNTAESIHSIRLATTPQIFHFNDFFQGQQQQNIQQQCGDFIIKRKDGLYAYQLAVVMDDADQGITEVVRGIDIMESTSRQMYLIQQLKYPQLRYAHFPVIINANGDKLSKQNHAQAISQEDPYQTTLLALQLLQQNPPKLKQKTQSALLHWAIDNWRPEKIFKQKTIDYCVATP